MGAFNMPLKPMRIGENQLTFMLESCRSLMFTDWAVKDSGVLAAEDIPIEVWDLAPVSECGPSVVNATDLELGSICEERGGSKVASGAQDLSWG